MPKGKSNIKFSGGSFDGEVYENVDSRYVVDEIIQKTGGWFRQNGDQVQIMKGGELDEFWLSYKIDVYKKGSKNKSGYFEYEFVRSVMVERCSAKTKYGNQCKKSCYKDLDVCETHK